MIDQYVQSRRKAGPPGARAEIRELAAYVPMVCTETYLRRVNGRGGAG